MSLGRLVGKLANVSRCNDTTNMGSLCNDTPVIGRSKVVSNKKRVEETTPHRCFDDVHVLIRMDARPHL